MIFQKILCPTDFSQASYRALQKAVELARPSATELCVVHVDQPTAQLSPMTDITPYAHSEAERRAEAVANLCAVLDERVPSSVRARPLLKCGDPATEIVRAAREEGADLIVLTTHGAGAAQVSGLGSVAEAVLRSAPCPVLTINPSGNVSVEATGIRWNHEDHGSLRPALKTVSSKAIYVDGD